MAFLLIDLLWLYIIIFGGICATIAMIADSGIWTSVVLVTTLLGLQFLAKLPLGTYFLENWQQIILWLICYLPIGVVWSFTRWAIFVRTIKFKYEDIREEWLKNHLKNEYTPNMDIPEAWRKDWISHITGRVICRGEFPPKAIHYKSDILTWISYWPLSIFAYIFGDFFTDLVKRLYRLVSNIYGRITTWILGKTIEKDFK